MAVSGRGRGAAIAAQTSGRANSDQDLRPAGRGRDGDGDRGARGGMDRRVRVRRVLVARVNRRLVGMAASGRRRRGLSNRIAAGALALAVAALAALHNSILGVVAALLLGTAAVGWIAGRREGSWAASGVLYAGALLASVGLLRASPSFGARRDPMAFCRGLGSGRRGLFRRTADRRAAALAERFAGQNLGRGDRRRARRRGRSASCCRRGRTASRRCSGSGWRRRSSRNLATCSNPAVKRRFGVKDSSRSHSRPRRVDGSARRLHRGLLLRGSRWPYCIPGATTSPADCFNGERFRSRSRRAAPFAQTNATSDALRRPNGSPFSAATGSIGRSCAQVIAVAPGMFSVVSVAGGRDGAALARMRDRARRRIRRPRRPSRLSGAEGGTRGVRGRSRRRRRKR